MQKKTLTILIVLCVITGILGWYLKYWTNRQWRAADDLVGKPIFAALVADQVQEISLRTINGELKLRRGPGGDWSLPALSDYPADPAKVSGFLGRLRALTANRQVAVGPDALGSLGLNPPTGSVGTGMDIVLSASDGRRIVAFRLGNQQLQEPTEAQGTEVPVTQPRMGIYLLLPATGKVYVVDQRAFAGVSDSPMAWADTAVLPVTISVQAIEARQAGTMRWRLQRDVADMPLALAAADAEVVSDAQRIAAIAAALPGMAFSRVVPAEDVDGMEFLGATTIRVTTFDNMVHALEFGQRNDQGETPLRLTVTFEKPPPPEAADVSSEAQFEAWQAHEERVRAGEARQRRLRQRYDAWVYYVPTVTADQLLVSATDLGVKPTAPPAGDDDDDEVGEPANAPVPIAPAPDATDGDAPEE